MPAIVVVAREATITEPGASLASSIATNFRAAQMGSDTNPNWGAWVGPAPRVTRVVQTGAARAWQTTGAWLYSWPETAFATAHRPYMQQQLLDSLRSHFGTDWAITASDYDPNVNGSVAWWMSEAAVTQTRDAFPTGAARLSAQENPTGPTTRATHPTTAGEALGDAGNWVKDNWWIFAILGGLLVLSKMPALKFPAFGGTRRSTGGSRRSTGGYKLPAGAIANPSLPNGRPAAWGLLPPGTEYGCKGKHVGAVVKMRRGGGTVRTCATPTREHPREGQYAIGLPGVGFTARKSAVSRAMRPRKELDTEFRRPKFDAVTEARLVEDFDRQRIAAAAAGAYIPQPTELEFPHAKGSSRCDVYHPIWQEMQAAVESMPGDYSTEDVARELKRHPRWNDWVAAEDECVVQWRGRARRAKAKAGFSTQREVAQRRQDALERGVDVTGAEYRDTLRGKPRKGSSATHRAFSNGCCANGLIAARRR